MEVEHVDLGSTADLRAFRRALAEAEASDAGSVFLLFVPMGFAPEEEVLGLLREVRGGKTYLACLMGLSSGRARVLGSVPVYRFPESAAIALARAWGYRRWREEPLFFPDFQDLRLEEARRLVEGKRALSQEEGEALLRAFGLSLGEEEGLRLRLLAEPHPLFGPVLVLVLPTPWGTRCWSSASPPHRQGRGGAPPPPRGTGGGASGLQGARPPGLPDAGGASPGGKAPSGAFRSPGGGLYNKPPCGLKARKTPG